MVNIKTESEKIKTFLIYFSVIMAIIMLIGIYFIYQEILHHAEDIAIHKQDTLIAKQFTNNTNQIVREHIERNDGIILPPPTLTRQ